MACSRWPLHDLPGWPAVQWTNLLDLQALARERLDGPAFDYIAGGAEDERTLRANRDDFGAWRLLPHVMRDVSVVDARVEVGGHRLPAPIAVAPTGFHGLAHPDAEVATARGAAAAGALMVASTLSNRSLEDIAAAGGPRWLQVYVFRDRKVTERLVERAAAAGYDALVLTVDVPVAGRRERDHRNRFAFPDGMPLGNFADIALPGQTDDSGSGLVQVVNGLLDPSLTWDAVSWLRDVSGLPVWVKGILRADDAEAALAAGAAGVIVSNHGGRQLDGAASGIQALPAVADAVGGRAPVLVDGGFRRGTDVLTAVALGADAVLVGRPVLWGLAVGGEDGVAAVLRHLRAETENAMRLLGVTRLADVDRSLLIQA